MATTDERRATSHRKKRNETIQGQQPSIHNFPLQTLGLSWGCTIDTPTWRRREIFQVEVCENVSEARKGGRGRAREGRAIAKGGREGGESGKGEGVSSRFGPGAATLGGGSRLSAEHVGTPSGVESCCHLLAADSCETALFGRRPNVAQCVVADRDCLCGDRPPQRTPVDLARPVRDTVYMGGRVAIS
jgi:hypothetical protein